MFANLGIALALFWLTFLLDGRIPYEGKRLTVIFTVLGLPAGAILLTAWLGDKESRSKLIRAALGLHAILLLLVCASPVLLLAYNLVARPGTLPPHRLILTLAVAPSILMSILYGAASFWVIFSPRSSRR
jgi:hypothetical protein